MTIDVKEMRPLVPYLLTPYVCSPFLQDVWLQGPGAFTGETSAEMLKDMGVQWTLTGHSERRFKVGVTSPHATYEGCALSLPWMKRDEAECFMLFVCLCRARRTTWWPRRRPTRSARASA
jgi:hypothetical protein